MGVIIFWIHYIVAVILLYHILFRIYIKGDIHATSYNVKYYKSDNDKKLKHPLWLILSLLIVGFIPLLNIIIYVLYFFFVLIDGEIEPYYRKYYCKSVFTKEY